MVEAKIVSSENAFEKRWLRFSYGSELSMHHFTERLPFTSKQRNSIKNFLQRMDDYSGRSSKLRQKRSTMGLRRIDVIARKSLETNGRRLFNVLKRSREIKASRFEDLFGEEALEVTLILDNTTRRFPWELAHDGENFLCMKYDVGRKVESPFWERKSGIKPEYRKALVVGLNYKWETNKKMWLYTAEREALAVGNQLEKRGYTVKLLRSKGKPATREEVIRILSDGVSIFHFSGHGAYRMHQPEGQRGSLVLRDGYLTEEDLRSCFNKAKGAPYLSFLNACQSAKEIYSSHFVDAFVEFGAEYVVGTFWPVYDEPSTKFSERFYSEIAEGQSIAHALYLARWQFISRKGLQESATWPSFVLYGSPIHELPKAR
jgi:CHAT domain-containing protein